MKRKFLKGLKANWKRNALIALCAFLALILVALVFGTVYIHSLLNNLGRVDPNEETQISASKAEDMMATDPEFETIDPSSTETIPQVEETLINLDGVGHKKHGSHVINILLVGQDRRPGEGRQRSDSMILVTLNKSKNTLTLTSIMRDQYVDIPGYLPNKLNAAYAFGGFKLLNATLEHNFGIYVDGNVEVDFTGFKKIIDMLGGVEIKLTQKEAEYLNEHHGFKLKEGTQVLTGKQALAYSRVRKLDTDYRRAERQRTVLLSLLNRYKQKPVGEMLSLMQDILPMITTDMSNAEILKLAGEVLPMLSSLQINNLRIPVDGTFEQGIAQVRPGLKAWVQYRIDFKANYQRMQKLFEQ